MVNTSIPIRNGLIRDGLLVTGEQRDQPGSQTVIRLTNVSVSFNDGARLNVVLDRVSLAIEPATFTAISGPSGSGKSTLLRVIVGLHEPDDLGDGTAFDVVVAGQHLNSPSARERVRRELVGFVSQDYSLLPFLSLLDNCRLSGVIGGPKVSRLRAEEALGLVGLGDLGDRMPDEVSGGQRQRAALARCIAKGSVVIVADEPTGSLDAESTDDVVGTLRRLTMGGATIVVATHDPAVLSAADAVARVGMGSLAWV